MLFLRKKAAQSSSVPLGYRLRGLSISKIFNAAGS
jgi:hypothetical protein